MTAMPLTTYERSTVAWCQTTYWKGFARKCHLICVLTLKKATKVSVMTAAHTIGPMQTFVATFRVSGLHLGSSGQSSWLLTQGPGFDSRRYQIFLVVGLERGPLSLMRVNEELLERKVAAPV
jgi:hypothetical protein